MTTRGIEYVYLDDLEQYVGTPPPNALVMIWDPDEATPERATKVVMLSRFAGAGDVTRQELADAVARLMGLLQTEAGERTAGDDGLGTRITDEAGLRVAGDNWNKTIIGGSDAAAANAQLATFLNAQASSDNSGVIEVAAASATSGGETFTRGDIVVFPPRSRVGKIFGNVEHPHDFTFGTAGDTDAFAALVRGNAAAARTLLIIATATYTAFVGGEIYQVQAGDVWAVYARSTVPQRFLPLETLLGYGGYSNDRFSIVPVDGLPGIDSGASLDGNYWLHDPDVSRGIDISQATRWVLNIVGSDDIINERTQVHEVDPWTPSRSIQALINVSDAEEANVQAALASTPGRVRFALQVYNVNATILVRHYEMPINAAFVAPSRGNTNLTQAQQIALLDFALRPTTIAYETGGLEAALTRTFEIAVSNAIQLTGDVWVAGFMHGAGVLARTKWTGHESSLSLVVNATNAAAIVQAIAGDESQDRDHIPVDLYFYAASNTQTIVDWRQFTVSLVQEDSGATPEQASAIDANRRQIAINEAAIAGLAADGAVGTSQLADGAVTEDKLSQAVQDRLNEVADAGKLLAARDLASAPAPTDENADNLLYVVNGHSIRYNRVHPTVPKSLTTRDAVIGDITTLPAGHTLGGVTDTIRTVYSAPVGQIWFVTQSDRLGWWVGQGSGAAAALANQRPGWHYYSSLQQATDRTATTGHVIIYGNEIKYVTGINPLVARFRTWDPYDPLWVIHPDQITGRLGYDKLPPELDPGQASPGAGNGAREVSLAVYQYGTPNSPAPAIPEFVYAAGFLSEHGDWTTAYPSVVDASRPLYRLILTATAGEAGAAWTVTHGTPEIIVHGYSVRFAATAAPADSGDWHAMYQATTDRYISFRQSFAGIDYWTPAIPIGPHGALGWQQLAGTTAGFQSWTFQVNPPRTWSALNDLNFRAIHFGAGYAILLEDSEIVPIDDVHLTGANETGFVAGRTYTFKADENGMFFGLTNDATPPAQPTTGLAGHINFRQNPLNPSQIGSIFVLMAAGRSCNVNFRVR